jgi:hypothetical protein
MRALSAAAAVTVLLWVAGYVWHIRIQQAKTCEAFGYLAGKPSRAVWSWDLQIVCIKWEQQL